MLTLSRLLLLEDEKSVHRIRDNNQRVDTYRKLSLLHDRQKAVEYLGHVGGAASGITDANQRARVYRKLGLLYRKAGQSMKGFGWGIRAVFVPGPMAVRVKSLAALLGFDR